MARAIVCLGGEPETDLGKLQVGNGNFNAALMTGWQPNDLCMQGLLLDKT